jgi:hypothetical protein
MSFVSIVRQDRVWEKLDGEARGLADIENDNSLTKVGQNNICNYVRLAS